jgi:hypothetical protein
MAELRSTLPGLIEVHMTSAQYKAMVDKRRVEFAKADRRARRLLEQKSDIKPSGATVPGFSFLIAPGVFPEDPKPASNVVSLAAKRAQRMAVSERSL